MCRRVILITMNKEVNENNPGRSVDRLTNC